MDFGRQVQILEMAIGTKECQLQANTRFRGGARKRFIHCAMLPPFIIDFFFNIAIDSIPIDNVYLSGGIHALCMLLLTKGEKFDKEVQTRCDKLLHDVSYI